MFSVIRMNEHLIFLNENEQTSNSQVGQVDLTELIAELRFS